MAFSTIVNLYVSTVMWVKVGHWMSSQEEHALLKAKMRERPEVYQRGSMVGTDGTRPWRSRCKRKDRSGWKYISSASKSQLSHSTEQAPGCRTSMCLGLLPLCRQA
jgi:hypothetical protein